jgi:hypothetical protein
MQPEEEILISQQVDRSWIVSLPYMTRPWAVESTRDLAIARARQLAPKGVARVSQPDGRTEEIRLGNA